jgi:hypothetical protein
LILRRIVSSRHHSTKRANWKLKGITRCILSRIQTCPIRRLNTILVICLNEIISCLLERFLILDLELLLDRVAISRRYKRFTRSGRADIVILKSVKRLAGCGILVILTRASKICRLINILNLLLVWLSCCYLHSSDISSCF